MPMTVFKCSLCPWTFTWHQLSYGENMYNQHLKAMHPFSSETIQLKNVETLVENDKTLGEKIDDLNNRKRTEMRMLRSQKGMAINLNVRLGPGAAPQKIWDMMAKLAGDLGWEGADFSLSMDRYELDKE